MEHSERGLGIELGVSRGSDDGELLGGTAAEPLYGDNVWELNVIAVQPARQGQGIGRTLIEDEEQVRQRGGLTFWPGSDDENGMTSLADVNLYPNPLEHLANISNRKERHYEFYQKMGFSLAGVRPDANSIGKPDIFLAKSVRNG